MANTRIRGVYRGPRAARSAASHARTSAGGAARTPALPRAAAKSAIVRPSSGCRHPGATSAQGTSTKARSRARGWGTTAAGPRPPLAGVPRSPSHASRSRSIVRGPQRCRRTRPSARSTASSPAAQGRLTGRLHLAFQARDRAAVEAFYEAGLANGGTDNGAPGERPYHPGYFAAFLLDPDGNNIEAVYHGEAERNVESIRITF